MKQLASAADVIRRSIGSSAVALLEAEPHVRTGDDPEAIHDARTAIRRLRSDLRVFAPFLSMQWATAFRKDLQWLGELLGAIRDADIVLARIDALAARVPDEDRSSLENVRGPIIAARAAAHARLIVAMQSDRYRSLRKRAIEAARAPRIATSATNLDGTALLETVQRSWRKLKKNVAKLGDQPKDEELHRVRKLAKRCRYAAQAVEPVAKRGAAQFARRITRIQDILGELHDVVVERERLRTSSAGGSASFLAGELAGLEAKTRERARARWTEEWKKLSHRRFHFWKEA